jgi:nitroimidazol reductase NimA-like FMN-containing flavoprotein (pyridoxamine 5'-phosphate oxidase superfamily)
LNDIEIGEHDMTEADPPQASTLPRASRPYMPGYGLLDANSGRGLLPWEWATERLEKARTYWVATARPNGQPHVMPLWGVWLANAFYFSTGRESRKARNLAANPKCVICVEAADESVIVEGVVEEINETAIIKQFADTYGAKYQWDMEGFAEPIYAVRPAVVFGFTAATGQFTGSATRWVFSDK